MIIRLRIQQPFDWLGVTVCVITQWGKRYHPFNSDCAQELVNEAAQFIQQMVIYRAAFSIS